MTIHVGKLGSWSLALLFSASMATLISLSFYQYGELALYLLGLGAFVPVLLYFLVFQPRYFIALFVFLIPMSVSVDLSGNVASMPSELLLSGMALLFVIRVIFIGLPDKKFLKHPISILLLVDILWTLVTSVLSVQPDVSFKRWSMKVMFILVFYLAWGPFFSRIRNIRLFFVAYALGMVVPIINTLANHSVHYFVMRAAFFVTEPFYPEHTIYAACLSFVIVMLVAVFAERSSLPMGQKLMILTLLLLLLVADYFAFSRAAWLSLFAGSMVWMFIRFKIPRATFAGVVVVLVVLLSANFDLVLDRFQRNTAVSSSEDVGEHIQSLTSISSDASNAERLNRWVSAWEMAKAKPFVGFGPGTYQFQYGVFQKPEYLTRISTFEGDKGNAHSEYLNVLAESGWMGLMLLVLLIFKTYQTGLGVYYTALEKDRKYYVLAILVALTTYFAHGVVNGFIDVDKASVLVYAGLAIIVQSHLRQGADASMNLKD